MIPTDPNSLKFKKAKFKNNTASTAKAGEYALEFVNGVLNVVQNGTAASFGDDTAYDATNWDNNVGVPTKNVVRDAIEAIYDTIELDGTIITHSATEGITAPYCRKQTHLCTGAYTLTLAVLNVGDSAKFIATTAAVLTLDCTTPNYFVLAGTALTAGNKITTPGLSAGDAFEIVCLATNQLYVMNANCVIIDGGA